MEWNEWPDVICVECPECGFTFDRDMTDVDTGTHSCSACAEIRLERENERLRAAIRGLLATGLTEAQYEGTDVGNINRARKSWLAAVTEARRALTPKRSPHPVTLEEAEAEYHAEGEK